VACWQPAVCDEEVLAEISVYEGPTKMRVAEVYLCYHSLRFPIEGEMLLEARYAWMLALAQA
jgi:hypothetical protein